jgi:tetratricopeptide (TPR) repeat protein
MALVNKSLLHRTLRGRYEVHELLRQYASEKLDQMPGAGEAVRDRYSAYYAAALQGWEADLKSARQQAALAAMDVEIENARSAWEWAVERGQVTWLDQAIEGLCLFYDVRGRSQEGEAACRRAVVRLEAAEGLEATRQEGVLSCNRRRVLAKALAWQAQFLRLRGRAERIRPLLRQSLTLLEGPELANQDTRAERAFVLYQMGLLIRWSGDLEQVRRLFEQSLALYRALGDQAGTVEVLEKLSWQARATGNYGQANRFAKESLALLRALGDRWGIAHALQGLGWTAWSEGQLEEAERLLREASAIRQETGLGSSRAIEPVGGLLHLGWTLLLRGQFAEAHTMFQEALVRCEDTGHRHQTGFALSDLGFAKLHLGRYKGARSQAQMSLTLAREGDILRGRPIIGRSLHALGAVALVGEAYAEAQQSLQESVAVYQEMGDRERLAQARAVLGYAACGLGDLCQARKHLSAALRTAADIGAFRPLVYALPAVALLLTDWRQTVRAVEVYASVSRHPFVANSRWFEDIAGKHIAAAAATLPPEVVNVAQGRGRARDLWATAEKLLAELEG